MKNLINHRYHPLVSVIREQNCDHLRDLEETTIPIIHQELIRHLGFTHCPICGDFILPHNTEVGREYLQTVKEEVSWKKLPKDIQSNVIRLAIGLVNLQN